MNQMIKDCQIIDLGQVNYDHAYEIQKSFLGKVREGHDPVVILCEHPVTLTFGRLGKEENLLIPRHELDRMSISVHRIDRGGDLTLHCPGQLVAYPIIDLSKDSGRDLRLYLRKLEQVAIDLLKGFDILAARLKGLTGVWYEDKKIVSLGVGVRKWISYHGMAINVNTDLKLFSMLRPCGLDVQMTSIAEIKNKNIDMAMVKENFVQVFEKNFCFHLINRTAPMDTYAMEAGNG